MNKKIIFTLLLLAIPISVAVVLWSLGEAHYRDLYGEMERDTDAVESTKEFFIYCPNLGWRGNPDVSTRHNSGSWVTHNAHGFRDTPWDLDTDKPRVLLLGDSNVWGYGVEDDEHPAALLNERYSHIRWVNSGMNGYATDQEYLLYKELYEKIQPDLTILVFCDNDRWENTSRRVRGYNKPYYVLDDDELVRHNDPVPAPLETDALYVSFPGIVFARTGSYVLYHLAHIVEARRQRQLQAEDGQEGHRYSHSPEDPTEALIAALNEATGERLMVATIPSDQGVIALCEQLGIPYIDMGETPARQPGPNTYPAGRPKYGHWTPEGNRIAAELIGDATVPLLEEIIGAP